MVINSELPVGLIANTTAVLGVSLGYLQPNIIGDDITDASGLVHKGITHTAIPVLAADTSQIRELHLRAQDHLDIQIISFSDVAQRIHSYDEYTRELSKAETHEIAFSGICLRGNKAQINTLTGALPLLR